MPGSLRCRARRRRSPSAQIENLAAGVDTLLFETGYCPAGKPRRELTAKIQAVGMYQHIADLFGVVLPIGRQTPDSAGLDRKSTRLNSSHVAISYAVFCLKKKTAQLQSLHLSLTV